MRRNGFSFQWLVAVLSCIVFLACNARNPSADDGALHITEDNVVNLDRPFTETMLQSWEAVFLDDSDDALLGDVSRLCYDDGLFFIESDAAGGDISIVVFDSLGHYRNRIGHRGNAGYEYVDFEGWTIDRDRNEVLIIGYNPDFCIKYYDYQGKYLRKQTIPDDDAYGPYCSCTCRPDGSVLLLTGFDLKHRLFYPDGGKVYPFMEDEYPAVDRLGSEARFLHMFECQTTDSYNGEIWLSRRLSNCLYRLADGDSIPTAAVSMDFRDRYPDKGLAIDNQQEYLPYVMYRMFNLRDYVLIHYLGDASYLLLDKNSMQMYRDTWSYEELVERPVISIPEATDFFYSCYDNTLVDVLDQSSAEDYLVKYSSKDFEGRVSPRLIELYQKAAKSENPVLVLYHLK